MSRPNNSIEFSATPPDGFCSPADFDDHVVQRSAAGSIVNIGSMYGQVGFLPRRLRRYLSRQSRLLSCMLKGGIIHMTRHLAVYWARDQFE